MKLQAFYHHTGEEPSLIPVTRKMTRYDDLITIINNPSINVDKPDETGLYPIHRAALIDNCLERTLVLDALIERGVDINVRTLKGGHTPLHIAVAHSHVPTVSRLLSKRPICDLPDHNGMTPYDLADENGCEEIMEILEAYQKQIYQIWQVPKLSGCSESVKKPESCACTIL